MQKVYKKKKKKSETFLSFYSVSLMLHNVCWCCCCRCLVIVIVLTIELYWHCICLVAQYGLVGGFLLLQLLNIVVLIVIVLYDYYFQKICVFFFSTRTQTHSHYTTRVYHQGICTDLVSWHWFALQYNTPTKAQIFIWKKRKAQNQQSSKLVIL